MADIRITEVDDVSVRKMLAQAERSGRTLDAVARDILLGALHASPAQRLAEADRVRAMTPSPLASSSTDVIREERDR